MRCFPTTFITLLLAFTATAQLLITTTLPFADGNTLVLEVTTDALGDPVTETLSTVTDPVTTPTKAVITKAAVPAVETTQRVVGQDESMAPMKTTTYGYDPGNGVWVTATWTASITGDPAEPTVIVPEGTIQDYNQYQSKINGGILASAKAQEASISGSIGAAPRRLDGGWNLGGVAGWVGLVVGGIGAGVGLVAM